MSVASPLVSIIVCVRNGMPHLHDAIESVRALTYRNFELVVQDGASTDGTLDYLRSIEGLPSVSIVSAPDTGIGQGFNRAVGRCAGDIVGSVDADNMLRPDALDIVVRRFAEHAEAAVVYGACDMVDARGEFLHTWNPPEFDLLGVMDGAVVPPFATSFFSRARCGARLCFDEEFRTVADFDLWLRLSDLPIVRVPEVLASVRVGEQSSTWNADNYDGQSGFKIRAIDKFLAGPSRQQALERLAARARSGIYLWAVESMAVIGGSRDRIDRYFAQATDVDVQSERFRDVLERARPSLPDDPAFAARLLQCGIEYLRRCRPETALVYLEYLKASGFSCPDLERWIERGRNDRWSNQTHSEVAEYLQGEINRRDGLNAEANAWWSNEVARRDTTINELRAELDWLRSGWRRFIIRRRQSPASE